MTHPLIDKPPMVFVFGSNTAGRHGLGAARTALKLHGARTGMNGFQGNSYGIPTKDAKMRTLPLGTIQLYINKFIKFAEDNPIMGFQVTRIGCGLAGYSDYQIAPMFKSSPVENVFFDLEWKPYIGELHEYWGTYQAS